MTLQPKSRPDVTQKGNAIVGDLRTDALHQALRERDIDDGKLLALLVLALGGKNVSIQSAAEGGRYGREALACGLIEGGVLATDQDAVRKAARAMLQVALSCRDNMTNSGIVARVAGDWITRSSSCRTWRPRNSCPVYRRPHSRGRRQPKAGRSARGARTPAPT